MRKQILAAALLLAPLSGAQAEAPTPECRPTLGVGGLLGAMNLDQGGRLSIGRLYALCLPRPEGAAGHFPYHPYEGAKLTTRVSDGRQVVATYVWYATPVGNTWELERYETLGGSNPPLAPGDYTLEFAAGQTPFFRFPFTVTKRAGDDPYAPPGEIFQLEGPWRRLARLYYQRNDPESSLSLTLWLQGGSTLPNPQPVPYAARIVRLQDGAEVAVDEGRFRLAPHWQKAELLFRPPGEEGRQRYTKARELLSREGEYRIELTLGGQPYGSYRVAVEGGRFVQRPEPAQLTEEPLSAIDETLAGGRYRAWWLLRE